MDRTYGSLVLYSIIKQVLASRVSLENILQGVKKKSHIGLSNFIVSDPQMS